jgi:FkbM family methyltransferase
MVVAASRVVGPTGEVVAFEPNPENLRRLHRTIELNELSNVRVRPVAVSDVTGEAQFLPHPESSMGRLVDASDRGTFLVGTTTLDAELATGRPPHLVKIDVEGHEASVLAGAEAVRARVRPVFIIEVLSTESRVTVTTELPGYRTDMIDRTNLLAIPHGGPAGADAGNPGPAGAGSRDRAPTDRSARETPR